MLDRGTMSVSDLYLEYPNLPILHPHLDPPSLLHICVDHYTQYSHAVESNAQPLTSYIAHSSPPVNEYDRRLMREYERAMELAMSAETEDSTQGQGLDQDIFLPAPTSNLEDAPPPLVDDEDDEDDDDDGDDINLMPTGNPMPPPSTDSDLSAAGLEHIADMPLVEDPTQAIPLFYDAAGDTSDLPDPFYKPLETTNDSLDAAVLPPHLLMVYGAVLWCRQHCQVSRVACNVLLWAFFLVIQLLAPHIEAPHVNLSSATHALGLRNSALRVLVVCRKCKDVYSDTDDTADKCLRCRTDLFKPSTTARGNARSSKIPWLKYPYMSISAQLSATLAIPGLEDVMDEWRTKERQPGVYQDIFDGAVSKSLLGPDRKPFFSNDPVGPAPVNPTTPSAEDSELRIGLAWAVDW
ncbi:hypothetical protein EUX98_g7506 [Antrodiella citrinella]|uniref:Uncharacterized protein n=1 Tax=Antrodiella citrinella TaxID=2447956 RepID=A0A4S4MNQ8_9APHY|nr:hypothetical protein EUX98_g7506 [Antrodiella citrinella]